MAAIYRMPDEKQKPDLAIAKAGFLYGGKQPVGWVVRNATTNESRHPAQWLPALPVVSINSSTR
jgi:hypothetical protein